MGGEQRIQKLIDETKHSIAKTHDLLIQLEAAHDLRIQLEAAIAGKNPLRDMIGVWRSEWHRIYVSEYDIRTADAALFKLDRVIAELEAALRR